jgi:hypothetical protein
MDTASSTNGGKEVCIWDIVEKPDAKKPLGRSRCRWVDNIKMDLIETG